MSIYYQDERITPHHGDYREVMSSMGDGSVDAVLTAPPHTDRTHANAKTSKCRPRGDRRTPRRTRRQEPQPGALNFGGTA